VQTIHLTHLIRFQFYPFHHFSFSEMSPSLALPWNSTVYITCIFSRCCLQYASILQAGIISQAVNWLLFFYIPEQKGPLLVVWYNTHSQEPRIQSFCTFYARQTIINCLMRHYSPTGYYLLVLVFHQEKNWLCWKCVNNYEVRSAIFGDFMQCGMVILTAIVLSDPWRWDW